MSPTKLIDHGGGPLTDIGPQECCKSHESRDRKGLILSKTTCLVITVINHLLSCYRSVCHNVVPNVVPMSLVMILYTVPYIDTCYVYPPDVADPCLNKECGFGAYCVPSLDGLAARCQCPTKCDRYGDSKDSVPICGSDGVDYANKCEMRRAACSEMRDVHTKYLGKCGKYLNKPMYVYIIYSDVESSYINGLITFLKPYRCKLLCAIIQLLAPNCSTL